MREDLSQFSRFFKYFEEEEKESKEKDKQNTIEFISDRREESGEKERKRMRGKGEKTKQ